MKKRHLFLKGLGTALVAASALYLLYRRARLTAVRRLTAESQVVQTAHGTVEFNVRGEGYPVLILHGAGTGYDQGLLTSYSGYGFQFISLSRPGYLRTPLRTGMSPEAQADASAALLDSLGISTAAVIGTSMGGAVAIQFALRHPQRCRALILISGVSQAIRTLPERMTKLLTLYRTDALHSTVIQFAVNFSAWLLINPLTVQWAAGAEGRRRLRASPERRAKLGNLLRSIFPPSLRAAGVVNDYEWIGSLPDYPLERITAPTLVIHGDADQVVPFAQAQYSASHIPGAQLKVLPGGDHILVTTHPEEVRSAVIAFLRAHAA